MSSKYRSYVGIDREIEIAESPKGTYVPEVQRWLPLAAEQYKISPEIADYVVVPLLIFPSDLPNRNSVAFPYEELMKFNVERGMPAYKTWRGMPCFCEHDHGPEEKKRGFFAPETAKGIIFDSYMKKIPNTEGNIYKVIVLAGFDRTKDQYLAEEIASGRRSKYSMGASIGMYECSVCGEVTRSRNTTCRHVTRGRINMYETAHGQKPGYYLARDISGFEISSVSVPAWAAAEEQQNIFDMRRSYG